MLGCKVGRKLNEGGAEFVSESQESIDEVVGGSVAVVEAAEVGDDLRKLGAKRKPLGHRGRPFCHAVSGVDAVVGGVEFKGSKLPAVVLRPSALRIFSGYTVPRQSRMVHIVPPARTTVVPFSRRAGAASASRKPEGGVGWVQSNPSGAVSSLPNFTPRIYNA